MVGNLNMLRETESVCEVDWKIPKFLLHLKGYAESWIKSPLFSWSSVDWQLQITFRSQTEIRLFLCKCTEKRFKVQFQLGIRLLDGTSEMRCSFIKHYSESETGYGTHEFILHSELLERKHELLSDEIFTISCLLLAYPNTLIKHSVIKYENLDVLSSNLKALYGCTKSSDMTIILEKQSYPVHKAILAARSDVFAAVFQHDMKETNSGIIKIVDCEPNSFKDFLLYIYTGKVENFSSNNVCHLYKAADKYNVQELKVLCVAYMERNISTTNLFDIATLANQFNEAELISLTQEFFNRNTLEIVRGDHWKEVMEQNFYIANHLLIGKLEKTEAKN